MSGARKISKNTINQLALRGLAITQATGTPFSSLHRDFSQDIVNGLGASTANQVFQAEKSYAESSSYNAAHKYTVPAAH
ncbi:MAG: hypothetical protein K9G62_04280 [Alphaproteobacteria bacterium]|nr:hypothetical protein [Alphaproteobacteria bacterium]